MDTDLEIDLDDLLAEAEPMGIQVTIPMMVDMTSWCRKYLVMRYGEEKASEIGEGMNTSQIMDMWMTAHPHRFSEHFDPTFLC
jgi:hypothetical protein